MMLASVVLAVVVTLVAVTTGEEGRGVTTTVNTPVVCPFPLVKKDGACVHSEQVKEAISASRRKREVVMDSGLPIECPRCVVGISDVYPKWDDCTKSYYCYDGKTIILDCRNFNASYFNPVTKACELSAQVTNICIYRTSPALLPASL
ncbi:hypothetical protein ACOMHN_054088 [Nucella lapillus]